MLVFVAPGSGRVAVVAGKRLGGAVQRNRARRVLRAAWSEVGPCAERDVVVVARSGIVGAKTQELVTEMSRLVAEAEPR
jgi:ribonuclease P protein component